MFVTSTEVQFGPLQPRLMQKTPIKGVLITKKSPLWTHNKNYMQLVLEPPSRFELETPSLPWKCSTTELRRHRKIPTLSEKVLGF